MSNLLFLFFLFYTLAIVFSVMSFTLQFKGESFSHIDSEGMDHSVILSFFSVSHMFLHVCVNVDYIHIHDFKNDIEIMTL